MKKDKPKSKPPAEKSPRKTARKARKAVDLVEVRKNITNIVGSEAAEMALAVVDEALKGQLAPVKYLFEVAGLYPAAGDAAEAPPEEDSLARTLLRRLGLPEDPVIVPEEEPTVRLALPAPKYVEGEEPKESHPKKDQKKTGAGAESGPAREQNHEGSASAGTNPVK
jgi:hypothetical protein